MHIWTDIFARELAMLLILFALGSGPASYLPRRFGAAARLAMAPALGLCLGTCVFTTILWFSPARHTYWLVPIVALISVAIALQREMQRIRAVESAVDGKRFPWRRMAGALGTRDALALALVCVVVAAPLSYTLHERHSVGPTGFEVWDAFAFTSEADGAVQDPIHTVEHKSNVFGQNFAQMYWSGTASHEQQFDAVPLSANVNEFLGLHSTDTETLFLIAFLITGALGAFAAIRYATPRPSWAAPLAGILFAGPFFLQLISDGSQPSTCGLALLLPIAAVGADALRRPRIPTLIVFALLISGLMALYPLFVPAVAITSALIVGIAGLVAWRRGALTRRKLLLATGGIGLVIALSAIFNLVSFLRDVRYWRVVLKGGYYLSGLPHYHLPYSVIPGWLLQTREFYSLTELGSTSPKEAFIGVALPLLFIAVIIFGIKRRRVGLMLALLVAVYALMGYYTSASHGCSYCTDRALLPIAPLGVGLLVLGIAALATAPSRWWRWAGVAVAIIAVVFVGERTRQERLRFSDGGYFLEAANGALLSHLPKNQGTLDIEAYGQDPGRAPGELPLVYLLGLERNGGKISVPSEYTDYAGLAYLLNANPANPQFDPNYRYILTRLGAVQTGRRVLARTGSVALEERTGPLDATLVSGVALPLERRDAQGLASVQGPLHFIVTGTNSKPAWVSLRFHAGVPVSVPSQPNVRARLLPRGTVVACARATGSGAIQRATIMLTFPLAPGATPVEPFAIQDPPQGVQLTEMRAVKQCVIPRA
jgi:hypothetical protein